MKAAYFWTKHGLKRSAAIFKNEAEARQYKGYHAMVIEKPIIKQDNIIQLIKGVKYE